MKNLNNIENFLVQYDNIIVKPIKGSEDVDGIELPTSYESKPQLGEIVKVGDGRLMENGTVVPLKEKVGDVVLFNKYSTTQFFLKGEEYLVLKSEDIIGIYRD